MRRLECSFSTFPDQFLQIAAAANPVQIGVDQNTLLPTVLTYQVQPDNGSDLLIPIEIHFSQYNRVNGVQVPFTIQRYVNGSLQLEIQVTSVQIN